MADPDSLKWIKALSIDELRKHLADRSLSTKGILPTLRKRLARFEASQLMGKEHIVTPEISDASSEDESDNEEGAVGGTVRKVPRIQLKAPTPPREPEYRTPLSDHDASRPRTPHARPTSAMDAYTIMRKWNLNFSGAR